MSLRAGLDMMVYISEFIMPGWFLMEIFIRCFKILFKQAPTQMLYSSIFVGAIIGLGFFLGVRYALRRYDFMPRFDAAFEAFFTSVYLFLVWFPLVIYIGFKIMFTKKDMNWGKTAHGLVQEEEASIKDFIKKELQKTLEYKDKLKQILVEKGENNGNNHN